MSVPRAPRTPHAGAKAYDRAYFDRWYRDPRRRVTTPASLARKVRAVLGIAEQVLERRVRRVLDVGCGEAPWRAALRRERPGLRYVGLESSAYAVARFGRTRGIRPGRFGTLDTMVEAGPFDLVVVCDVLQYVADRELRIGLAALPALIPDGVAFLEAYAAEDAIEGDRAGWQRRSAARYRRAFGAVGLAHVGMHCWVGPERRDRLHALETTR